MRLGIRLQLLLALGSLLVLAFVPLFFAVASLTRASMAGVRESSARSLGRAVGAHVLAARAARRADALLPLLEAQVGTPQEGVAAIGLYDRGGALVHEAGDADDESALPRKLVPGVEQVTQVHTSHGAAVLVVVPSTDGTEGSVATVLRTDPATTATAPLVRLFALYTAVMGLALLVFAYFAMTRLVVRPIERLSHAARRVAEGSRRLEVPRSGAREIAEVAASVVQMTERLLADEDALRTKIDELERAGEELRSAQERLVRSERLASVGRLAAGLAHEIGNPIAAILGFQELMLAGGLDASEQRDFLERMKKETERVHRVLRDLLDFARPAVQGGSSEKGEPGAVAEAIRDVVALVGPQKAFRDVEVEVDISPGLPPVGLAHERIVQVVLNLLLNAADAVPSAGGKIRIVAQRGGKDSVRLEVEDNGPGVSESVRDRLFEPFVTTKEVGKGTGLGLAVCRGLVEAVGGSIRAERGTDDGARFVLELPVERPGG